MNKKKRHFTIPIFIPELACPNRCIYCNQHSVSGQKAAPTTIETTHIVDTYLESINKYKFTKTVEIGFFGGNFTGLPIDTQSSYLSAVERYINNGSIDSIRLSTRPDYINPTILEFLKEHHVETIEIGVQSLDDQVLSNLKRGHSVNDSLKAARLIKEYGFNLGIQFMCGLPGQSKESFIKTAEDVVGLNPDFVRIYPLVVLKNTELEELYYQGKFRPVTVDEAVLMVLPVYELFKSRNIHIIRMGLHPSEGLISGKDIVDGPFHTSFRELVLTAYWKKRITDELERKGRGEKITIRVSPIDLNYCTGYNSDNKSMLLQRFKQVRVLSDDKYLPDEFSIDFC